MPKKDKKNKAKREGQKQEYQPASQLPPVPTITPESGTPKTVPPTDAAPEPTIWQRNIQSFEDNWKVWTKDAAAYNEPIMVREAYRTTDGSVFFEYADFGRLPVARSVRIQLALLKTRFAVTETYVEDLQKDVTAAIAAKNSNKVLELNKEFFDRNKLAPDVATMCDLAALFFIRHDENPYIFCPLLHGKKVKQALENYHLQAFFLGACYRVLGQVSPQQLQVWNIGSETAFQDYLEGKVPMRKTK
jgi:hypothetical protein